jgi:hypothetical protein
MPADFTIVSGDTSPVLTRALQYSDQTPVDLNGMTVALQMRSMTDAATVTLASAVVVTNAALGEVSYTFASADTAAPGNYLAKFVVTAGSDTMSFPTDGYLWIEVQPSLGVEPQQLVSLPDAKMELNIGAADRHVDFQLIRWIEAARPLVEHITGPILLQQFEEWHAGGQVFIMLRRRPSSAMGTSPIIIPIAVSEYNGPIEWPLSIVASPDRGQTYSCMFDQRLGMVVRRTAGGGVQAFPYGPQAVHVIYQAGQATIPANVRQATIELLRENYMNMQQVGSGAQTVNDAMDVGYRPLVFGMSPAVKRLLMPNRRHPSIA